jgi:hypothetical protein
MNNSASMVAQTIRPFLADFEWKGVRLSVDEQSIYNDNGWWYVSVQPNHWPQRLFPVVEELGIISERLEEEHDLKVMFSLGEALNEQSALATLAA